MRTAVIVGILIIIPVIVISMFGGWSVPTVPPEVMEAEIQAIHLRGTGSEHFASDEYFEYKRKYRQIRLKFLDEKEKFPWFRDYDEVADEFRSLLAMGDKIEAKINRLKEIDINKIKGKQASLNLRIDTLKAVTLKMNEGRFARSDLMRAELFLVESVNAFSRGNYQEAKRKIENADNYVNKTLKTLDRVLKRYRDKTQIARWMHWISGTLHDSLKKGTTVIIVNKLDRELILYKKGVPVKTYRIGLGPNGLSDKVHAGDNATPEGRYHIISKIYYSKYHRALLLDYPNPEDKRSFLLAKKKGLVPAGVGPGSLIEIHGGGKEFMTRGCVSLDNNDIEELFLLVNVGTPVTIVGSVGYPDHILSPVKETPDV
jgi:lipoprotein-anchoring transpeptidase ErfK/SrfK